MYSNWRVKKINDNSICAFGNNTPNCKKLYNVRLLLVLEILDSPSGFSLIFKLHNLTRDTLGKGQYWRQAYYLLAFLVSLLFLLQEKICGSKALN